jgi:predicted AlkP superfamily phosphohydrolase/phosphomutase
MSNKNFGGNRVMLIGIDGATFNLIQPLVEKNRLPFFQKIMNQGSYGVLKSDLPLNSAANWTSLFTGKNPGKHNIYDFFEFDKSSYQPKFVTNQSLKSELIWNVATSHDLQTVVLNAPVASQPEPLNGIRVSGFLTPSDQRYAYPEDIAKELRSENYPLDSGFAKNLEPKQYFDQIMKTLEKQEKTFGALVEKHPWDLAILTLNALGKAQHDFWCEEELIEALYVQIDTYLQSLYQRFGEDSYFVVVSHHGFKSVTKKFFVNEWLWELGLLEKIITIKKSRLTDIYDVMFQQSEEKENPVTNFFAKAGITKDNIRSILPVSVSEMLKRIIPWGIKKYFPMEYLDIEWSKTQAYFVSTNVQGININLAGREPQGTVEPGDAYENLRDKIIGELYRLKDPYTLENVVDEIYRKEDLFRGDNLEMAPDIIFVPHEYTYFLDPNKRTSRLFIGSANDNYDPIYSYHEPNGILAITGPNIKKGKKLSNIDIYDVAPTVLHLLEKPIPEEMDGEVLYRIFEEADEFIYKFRPQFLPSEEYFSLFPGSHFTPQPTLNPVYP